MVGDKSENESRVFAGFIGTLFFELAAGLSRRSENASNLSFLKASGFRGKSPLQLQYSILLNE